MRPLKERLREQARARLSSFMRAVTARNPQRPGTFDLGRLLVPFAELDRADCCAFYVGCDEGSIDLERVAPAIRAREEQLLACLLDFRRPNEPERRQRLLINLADFQAGVFIPVCSHREQFKLATHAATAFGRRVTSPEHRTTLTGGGEGSLKYLALAPVLWSLAAHCP